jgi:hypothetical protein
MNIEEAIDFFEATAKASARIGIDNTELLAVANISCEFYTQVAEWLKELKPLKERPKGEHTERGGE